MSDDIRKPVFAELTPDAQAVWDTLQAIARVLYEIENVMRNHLCEEVTFSGLNIRLRK